MKRKRLLQKIKFLNGIQFAKLWSLVLQMKLLDWLYHIPPVIKFFSMASIIILFLYSMLQPDQPLLYVVIIDAGLSVAITMEWLRVIFERKGTSLTFSKSRK